MFSVRAMRLCVSMMYKGSTAVVSHSLLLGCVGFTLIALGSEVFSAEQHGKRLMCPLFADGPITELLRHFIELVVPQT